MLNSDERIFEHLILQYLEKLTNNPIKGSQYLKSSWLK